MLQPVTLMLVCCNVLFIYTDNTDFRVTPLEAIMVTTSQMGSVQLLAEADSVALEPVESFFLTMEIKGTPFPMTPFASRNAFFYNRIEVFIEQASGKYFLLLVCVFQLC